MDTEKNDLPPQFDASQALVDIHVQDNGLGIRALVRGPAGVPVTINELVGRERVRVTLNRACHGISNLSSCCASEAGMGCLHL